jgi:hypothetical protein
VAYPAPFADMDAAALSVFAHQSLG